MEQRTHKEVLSRHKVELLKTAAAYIADNVKNDFPLSRLGNPTDYANFQKLRYHGLVHHVTVNGVRKRGHWLITRNGWAFLRGELSLPSYVYVQKNRIVGKSDRMCHIRDVIHGYEGVVTTFEYFDEQGEPVGYRPTQVPSQQIGLAL